MAASTPEERLVIALEMADLGVQMVRSRLQREHPEWSEAEIQEGIMAWRRDRPGAPHGDYPGPRSNRDLESLDP